MSENPPTASSGPLDGAVDLHCHILPGIDDGPRTMADAVALCRVMSREGLVEAVATPHMLGRYELSNTGQKVRAGVIELQAELNRRRVRLKVHAGGEIRLDERIGRLLSSGGVLPLGDAGKYLLLELPMGVGFEAGAVLPRVSAGGVRVVLAHVERYEFVRRDVGIAQSWVDAGAVLQVNATSFTPSASPGERAAAWELATRGWVSVVATDAHSLGDRRPRWAEATQLLLQRLGPERTRLLCVDNPRRILAGQSLD